MIKGVFTSASGMIPRLRKQEISANNMANASTPGFKKDRIFAQELSRVERKRVATTTDWQKPMVTEVYTDFSQGILDRTGNTLDVAIDGDGFFTLQLPDGQQVLTRSGSFTVNQNGLLAFPGDALVLGEGGPLQVGSGVVSISQTGQVESDGLSVGRLIPVTVNDLTLLKKIGGSYYLIPEGEELIPVQQFSLHQGFIEASNVDIVSEMINMIASFREYEANARAIQSQDQTLDNLFRRVGGNG